MVVFWKWVETDDEETHEKKEVPFLRYYNVFHISQCEGLTAKYDEPLPATVDPNEIAEAFIADDEAGIMGITLNCIVVIDLYTHSLHT